MLKRDGGFRGLCVVLFIVAASSPAIAELANVWALDDGTKVKATDTSHSLEAGNGLFNASEAEVSLFGLRNETVAFQVILEGGGAATSGVRVLLDSIGPIQNSGLSGDWDEYYLGRRIELFAQHYLEVTTRSHDLAWLPGSSAEPSNMTGWIPDGLIPLATTDTMTVAAGRNQGVWIDIYIPSSTPPGNYTATLTVEVDGNPCALPTCQLEVALEVLSSVLPDEPTARTMLYFSGGEGDRDQMWSRYSGDPWSDDFAVVESMRMRHYKLGRRNRVSMFIGGGDAPDPYSLGRVDGSAFSLAQGYEGPGQGVGQDVYSIHTYGGSLTSAEAATWSSWFASNGPDVDYFLYTMDEPGADDFSTINAIAAEAEPVPAFVTHEPAAGLDVDIYCAGAQAYSIGAAATATAAGKQVWIYNGVRPFTGSFVVDDVAVSTRVNPWIQYKYAIPRWFYWESTYYNDFQGGQGQVDVFTEPINFTNSWGDEMNGDGLLIYPGRDVIYAAQDRAIEHPLPSIRLKNWRRGIQDIEYLVLVANSGQQALVDSVLAELVPSALDEGGLNAGDAVPWEEDGEVWLQQRLRLANALRDVQPPDGGVSFDAGAGADGGTGADNVGGGCCRASDDGAASTLVLSILVVLFGGARRRRSIGSSS